MKYKYQSFTVSQQNGSKIYIYLFVISSILILIGISIWKSDIRYNIHIVTLKNHQLTQTLSNKFLSFGLDSSLLRKMIDCPINSKKFINLAHYLSPAYVRIGGTAADCLWFKEIAFDIEVKQNNKEILIDKGDISNFSITGSDFLSLYRFSQKTGLRMVFDLNTLSRNIDGTWNSKNVKEIILFAKSHGMELDWQMGNEPNSFFHVFNIEISAEQLAKDYCELRTILDETGFQESILVGPEVNHVGDENHSGKKYADKFLNNVKQCVDYISWHQYYLNGHTAQVQDFVNYKIFNRFPEQINVMTEVIQSSGQNISMWLSETSSAYGGGAEKLSDRFVAGFLWLDKLGCSAKAGIKVIIRQSFFGGNYAMVGPDLTPNPDWWVAILYKQFVSEKVLNLVEPNNFGNLRMYAHCASNEISTSPSIVIYGMNLNNKESRITIQGISEDSKVFSYILTSNTLQSRNIYLNEEILKLQNNGTLPFFKPKIKEVNEVIILPAYSIVFFIIQGMEIPACL